MTIAAEATEAQVRAGLYSLLSQCFFQPSEDLVASIAGGTLVEALQLIVGMDEDNKVEHEISRIKNFGMKCQGLPLSKICQDMKVEYNRLFVGPGHLEAPPYESVYKTKDEENEDGLVMGEATIAVKRFYRSAGIELADHFTDLPDHIAVELNFMAHLCSLESESEKEGNENLASICKMQADFLTEHLGTWIAEFAHAVRHSTNSDFYGGIVSLTEVWVQSELEALQN